MPDGCLKNQELFLFANLFRFLEFIRFEYDNPLDLDISVNAQVCLGKCVGRMFFMYASFFKCNPPSPSPIILWCGVYWHICATIRPSRLPVSTIMSEIVMSLEHVCLRSSSQQCPVLGIKELYYVRRLTLSILVGLEADLISKMAPFKIAPTVISCDKSANLLSTAEYDSLIHHLA